jgi:hypothetical protein
MSEDLKTERVQLFMTPEEVRAIDDWSFANRIRGRSEAIRRLCKLGLSAAALTDDQMQDFAGQVARGTAVLTGAPAKRAKRGPKR